MLWVDMQSFIIIISFIKYIDDRGRYIKRSSYYRSKTFKKSKETATKPKKHNDDQ